jgi:hypothetical protein
MVYCTKTTRPENTVSKISLLPYTMEKLPGKAYNKIHL